MHECKRSPFYDGDLCGYIFCDCSGRTGNALLLSAYGHVLVALLLDLLLVFVGRDPEFILKISVETRIIGETTLEIGFAYLSVLAHIILKEIKTLLDYVLLDGYADARLKHMRYMIFAQIEV